MDTKGRLENDLKTAIRSNDELRKRTLRMALAAIRLVEVDKGSSLDEAGTLNVLQKEVKSRQESIEDAQRAERSDLVNANRAEMEVLEEYLPKQLSPEELELLARQTIADVGASSIREMGQVMKVLIPRLENRATGDQASQVVRRLLQ
jgi:uncharacterized protein YqeY